MDDLIMEFIEWLKSKGYEISYDKNYPLNDPPVLHISWKIESEDKENG